MSFAQAVNRQWRQNQLNTNRKPINIEHYVKEQSFSEAFDEAYNDHAQYNNRGLGYSIYVNQETGDKEMFVAGSQGWKDWVLNAIDGVLYQVDHATHTHVASKLDFYRRERSKKLSKIAKDQHVDVVYGHSRGGAVVADMDFDGRKVGIDAAMIIADNNDMTNYNTGSMFDSILGFGGNENVTIDQGRGFHWVYGD